MTEIIFLVEDDAEGGYVARAIGESIFTLNVGLKALGFTDEMKSQPI